jgi:hypothetical protein
MINALLSAKNIMDAFLGAAIDAESSGKHGYHARQRMQVAAVLHAVKDEVAPWPAPPDSSTEWAEYNRIAIIRELINDIANELESRPCRRSDEDEANG